MRGTQYRDAGLFTALSVVVGAAALAALTAEQIRPRLIDAVSIALLYFGFVGVLAVLARRLLGVPSFVRTLPTFQVAAAIALLVAVVGLRITFTYVPELDAPIALALTGAWFTATLATAIGVATHRILHRSFAEGFALTALAAAGLIVAALSAPLLGIGR